MQMKFLLGLSMKMAVLSSVSLQIGYLIAVPVAPRPILQDMRTSIQRNANFMASRHWLPIQALEVANEA
jgi:hypothetical protein